MTTVRVSGPHMGWSPGVGVAMGSKAAGERGARSRLGGVPTIVGTPAPPPRRQLALALDDEPEPRPGPAGPSPARPSVLLPGVAHVPGWLDAHAQRALVADFRRWAEPPAGLRHPRVPTGHLMTVQSVCLGWHWSPYAYSRTADDTDGAPVKPLAPDLADLGRAAVDAAYGPAPGADPFRPDAAIVNLYTPDARLGAWACRPAGSASPCARPAWAGPTRRRRPRAPPARATRSSPAGGPCGPPGRARPTGRRRAAPWRCPTTTRPT